MGLDITACSKLVLVQAEDTSRKRTAEESDAWYERMDAENLVHIYNAGFNRIAPWVPGLYRCDGEWHGFRAGSYSGYNEWREWLASLIATTPEAVWNGLVPTHFRELIDFSDCEGTIGTEACVRLLADFREWAPKVGTEGRYAEKFREWLRAFELGADSGAVRFH